MESPVKVLLEDEIENEGVKYTNAFKDFVKVWYVVFFSSMIELQLREELNTVLIKILLLDLHLND